MPINEHKDMSRVVARMRIKAGDQGHHFDVYLWEDLKSMRENADGCEDQTVAIVNHEGDYFEVGEDGGMHQVHVDPLLGEIHFARGKWNMEITAHELTHALLGRFRKLPPDPADVIEQVDDHEEMICYEFGKWVDQVYSFLWANDPSEKWEKVA